MGYFLIKTEFNSKPKSCLECKLCTGWDMFDLDHMEHCPLVGVMPDSDALKDLLVELMTDFDCDKWATSDAYRRSFTYTLMSACGVPKPFLDKLKKRSGNRKPSRAKNVKQ